MKNLFCFIILISFILTSNAQVDSIYDQGTFRSFILHLPSGYNPDNNYPLVLNFHGLGSSAFEQQLYSQFDAISNAEDFIVVYPDAINNSWDIFGSLDVTFVSNLVDTLRDRYSINDCLFSMGMSQGGFLSYKLACELDKPLTAIAIVTGGMTTFMQSSCNPTIGMPVVHFHGTDDEVVPYEGTFGIPPVEETVSWWANENNCHDLLPIISLPDTNTADSSTVEQYTYPLCMDEAEVILYKVLNGGHTWPGAFPIPNLGVTNQDINASEIIGDFFTTHCETMTSVATTLEPLNISVFPNPASDFITISVPQKRVEVFIYNIYGQPVTYQNFSDQVLIDCSQYSPGIYLAIIRQNHAVLSGKLFIVNH